MLYINSPAGDSERPVNTSLMLLQWAIAIHIIQDDQSEDTLAEREHTLVTLRIPVRTHSRRRQNYLAEQ